MRNATISSQNVDLLMDIEQAFNELANADGFVCPKEARVKLLMRRAVIKGLRMHGTHKWVKNILDNGDINVTVERDLRELNRDIAALDAGMPFDLNSYRAERFANDTSA
jgi:hypothetical protein